MKGGSGLIKTSAPGLAVAGIAHMAGAEGRRSYLTIATGTQIHSLTNETPGSVGKKANKGHNEIGAALEAAGNAVLGASPTPAHLSETPPPTAMEPLSQVPAAALATPTSEPTLASRLRELSELHTEGILSDDEFAGAKAKLLGGL
jgi:hypothetical protein